MPRNAGIVLPISLPSSISYLKEYDIKIVYNGIKLPACLPTSIGGISSGKKNINTTSPLIISIKEMAEQVNYLTIPISEVAWDFKGLILEETIVDNMSTSFMLYEDIRARILTNIEMIDKNHILISWYGQQVAQVMIFIKSQLDNEYKLIRAVPWSQGNSIVEVPEDAINIKLEGLNSTGESSVVILEDGFNTEVKTNIDIALNLKVFYLETDRESVYRLKINY